MKHVMLLICAVNILFLASFANAVDGYKDLKFGVSKQQALAHGLCTFQKIPKKASQHGAEYYACDDFKFGKRTVDAAIFFINDRFLRFAISPPISSAESIMEGLARKYGAPSYRPKKGAYGFVQRNPNQSVNTTFDDNTVVFTLKSNHKKDLSILLIYTSPQFDRIISQNETKSLSDDL